MSTASENSYSDILDAANKMLAETGLNGEELPDIYFEAQESTRAAEYDQESEQIRLNVDIDSLHAVEERFLEAEMAEALATAYAEQSDDPLMESASILIRAAHSGSIHQIAGNEKEKEDFMNSIEPDYSSEVVDKTYDLLEGYEASEKNGLEGMKYAVENADSAY